LNREIRQIRESRTENFPQKGTKPTKQCRLVNQNFNHGSNLDLAAKEHGFFNRKERREHRGKYLWAGASGAAALRRDKSCTGK
jgi:hypothetical protein